jgi:hypothetical protein
MKSIIVIFLPFLISFNLLSQSDTLIKSDSVEVFYIVDSMPTMPNGEEISIGLRRLIMEEFKYPDSLDCGLISTIIFEFTISSTGKIKDDSISFRSNYDDCLSDYDKLRKAGDDFYKNLPVFNPGKHKGKLVAVKFIYPLQIHLQ